MQNIDIEAINTQIRIDSAFLEDLKRETQKVIVGQEQMIDRLLLGLLTNGHVLLEGLPGLAKTMAIKALSKAINSKFSRIQFTPDLLPADIIGTMIYNPSLNEFTVRKGPIFANFILTDEINRAPAKVQSALLEAMQEKQVTIGNETFFLEEPFLVLATQNPIEQEGTYPLPEAQVDRFMLKVKIGYPTLLEEKEIIRRSLLEENPENTIRAVVQPADILKARQSVKRIYMDEKIERYILDIVFATRFPQNYGLGELSNLIQYGASPRASVNLAIAGKANAFLHRRGFVIPEDIRQICPDILRHRIGLTYEAEAENVTQEDIITKILNKIEVP
ncbi:MAG: MoxR family ATPase [Saprospiraceae bacterium]|jgi:MoxR-like ATPase|nr:MoxR family ATPase [Saprospiraceae bacterium]MDP4700757.1 MoxR family ATPase [Saprospiraceae bacterium]MDP4811406.1 MoxR family ATPase [Saprospiraceae bacterium]MDP4815558.1 MoxR family ATPase [Saprospiraceae bacterium]MDP4915162.1 MoxR family ATPase [Saprospiraceae bacterium]